MNTAPPPVCSTTNLDISATVIDFGVLRMNETRDAEVKITNRCTEPLVISRDYWGSDWCAWSYAKEPIRPGGSTVLKAHLVRQYPGTFERTYTLITNFGEVRIRYEGEVLSLTDSAKQTRLVQVQQPVVLAPPAPRRYPKIFCTKPYLRLDTIYAGETVPLTWTITNAGEAPLKILNVTGEGPVDYPKDSIAVGKSATLTLHYTPRISKGTTELHLYIHSNAGNALTHLYAIGYVNLRQPKLVFDSTTIRYACDSMNQPVEAVFHFVNKGNAPLKLDHVFCPSAWCSTGWTTDAVPPGGKGEVRLRGCTDAPVRYTTLTVTSNDPTWPGTQLYFQGYFSPYALAQLRRRQDLYRIRDELRLPPPPAPDNVYTFYRDGKIVRRERVPSSRSYSFTFDQQAAPELKKVDSLVVLSLHDSSTMQFSLRNLRHPMTFSNRYHTLQGRTAVSRHKEYSYMFESTYHTGYSGTSTRFWWNHYSFRRNDTFTRTGKIIAKSKAVYGRNRYCMLTTGKKTQLILFRKIPRNPWF